MIIPSSLQAYSSSQTPQWLHRIRAAQVDAHLTQPTAKYAHLGPADGPGDGEPMDVDEKPRPKPKPRSKKEAADADDSRKKNVKKTDD